MALFLNIFSGRYKLKQDILLNKQVPRIVKMKAISNLLGDLRLLKKAKKKPQEIKSKGQENIIFQINAK